MGNRLRLPHARLVYDAWLVPIASVWAVVSPREYLKHFEGR